MMTEENTLWIAHGSENALAGLLSRMLGNPGTGEPLPEELESGAWKGAVSVQGTLWACSPSNLWEAWPEERLHPLIARFDGARCGERRTPIKLSASMTRGITKLLQAELACPDFFNDAPRGVACRDGFLRLDGDRVVIEPLTPDHKARWAVPVSVSDIKTEGVSLAGTLLGQYFDGSFKGRPEKDALVSLLAEVLGVALFGLAPTVQKMVLLLGSQGRNGKSVFLSLLRGLAPPQAQASIPFHQVGDQNYLAKMAGVVLNASDELSGFKPTHAATVKSLISCEPLLAAQKYQQPFEFIPRALQVHAGNGWPRMTDGGVANPLKRRTLAVPFDRVIPDSEIVHGLASRIIREELPLLASLAVWGALRVVQRGDFTAPSACLALLDDWTRDTDPVGSWVEECLEVTGNEEDTETGDTLFSRFRGWCVEQGFTACGRTAFVQRLAQHGGSKPKPVRVGSRVERRHVGVKLITQSGPTLSVGHIFENASDSQVAQEEPDNA
jgi:P4 family phage/plasmid primase-like protien